MASVEVWLKTEKNMGFNLLSIRFQRIDILRSTVKDCGVCVPTSSPIILVLHIHSSTRNVPRKTPPGSDKRTLSNPKLVRICAVVRAHSGRQFGTTRANVEGFAVEVDLRRRLDLLPF